MGASGIGEAGEVKEIKEVQEQREEGESETRNTKFEKRIRTKQGDGAAIPPLRNGKRRRCSGRDDKFDEAADVADLRSE